MYLEAKGLKKKYKEFTLEMDLSIKKNELVAILGPSGCGKSTLLSLLSGVEKVDEGTIVLDGKDITKEPIEKRGIGFIFQSYTLFPSMNVQKNIEYGMKIKNKKEREEFTANLLSLVELNGYQKRKVDTLSGGEAQRVALVRAVAAEPQILFLDEPLSALDAPMRKKLRGIVRTLHDNLSTTMLYVTHDKEEAFAIADRIIIMRDGQIESEGEAEELYSRPKTLFTAFFTGDGTALDASLIYGEGAKGKVFFRPESVTITEEAINPDLYPNHLVFNNCEIRTIEYKGSGYMVGLDFFSNPIIAFSQLKPKKREVSLLILRDNLIKID